MGFINTGQTDLVIYLTHVGAEYLAGKKKSATDLVIKYFTLGDSDNNYFLQKRLHKGFVPDLTGEDASCLKIVNTNIKNSQTITSFHRSVIYKDGEGTNSEITYFGNSLQSMTLSKNDCVSGTGSTVTYFVEPNTYKSLISQTDADNKAILDINTNAQAYANANGSCTQTVFWNTLQSQNFNRNNCGMDDTGSTVTYTVSGHTYSGATLTDANNLALADITANGQTYANTNGTCTQVIFWNTLQSQDFQRNNCGVGETGTTLTYTVSGHTYSGGTLTIANNLALADITANGQNYANTNGTCLAPGVFYNVAKSGNFSRNNCGSEATGSTVTYSVGANTYTGSTQSIADNLAQNDVDTNGQSYANTNGTCTTTVFWNVLKSGNFSRNNCGSEATGSTVTYSVSGHTYSGSTQLIADNLAQSDVDTNGQSYANANGSCTQTVFWNTFQSQDFQRNDCTLPATGSTVTYSISGHTYSGSTLTIANNLALDDITANGQTYANTNGTCITPVLYYSVTSSYGLSGVDPEGSCIAGDEMEALYTTNSDGIVNIDDCFYISDGSGGYLPFGIYPPISGGDPTWYWMAYYEGATKVWVKVGYDTATMFVPGDVVFDKGTCELPAYVGIGVYGADPQTGGTNRYGFKIVSSRRLTTDVIIYFDYTYENASSGFSSGSSSITLPAGNLEYDGGMVITDASPASSDPNVVVTSTTPVNGSLVTDSDSGAIIPIEY